MVGRFKACGFKVRGISRALNVDQSTLHKKKKERRYVTRTISKKWAVI